MRWFAVYTRSNHERKVDHRLQSAGITTFLPEVLQTSRRWDRKKVIRRALFPGYLFVRMPLSSGSFLEVARTPGVCYLLATKGQPAPIPDPEIDSLMIMLSDQREVRPIPFLKKGAKVRVVSGALKGAVGILVDEDHRRRRLVVSIELMRRSVSTLLHEEEVEAF